MHVLEPFSGMQQVLLACVFHLDQHDLQKEERWELEYKGITKEPHKHIHIEIRAYYKTARSQILELPPFQIT